MGKVYKTPRRDRLVGADVLITGLFSAKQKDYEADVEATAAIATACGARVVGHMVQRRGVSHGGVAVMGQPFSRRALLRDGKIREIAQRCQDDRIDAVVVVNDLTEQQRRVLEQRLGRPVFSRAELEPPPP